MEVRRGPATSVDEVLDLYARWGEERYDEELSQASHAVQVAAWAVRDEGTEDEVAAALLHDVGHLLVMEAHAAGEPVVFDEDWHHELLGARYLGALFPATVTSPIALHVQAKRYRCAVDPTELDRLSAGSQASLVRQGGPMSAEEAERFARRPAAASAIRLRGWDDAGKALDADPPPVAAHRDLLVRVAGRQGTGASSPRR